MLTMIRAVEEVDRFRERLDSLYSDVRQWVSARAPATFTRDPVELSEESPGEYTVDALEVRLPDRLPIRFVPRGVFMVGARGHVDAENLFGREMLVWVEAEDPEAPLDVEPEILAGRPIYPGVPQGWAWADPRRNRLVPLSEAVLWDHVLSCLVR